MKAMCGQNAETLYSSDIFDIQRMLRDKVLIAFGEKVMSTDCFMQVHKTIRQLKKTLKKILPINMCICVRNK